jgi:opacity protein-like surface antigen
MKKVALLVGISFVTICGWTQVKFGVFIDPQYTWMTAETREASSDGGYMGLCGGLSIDNYFAKNYAFSTALSLGTQGGSISYTDEKVIKIGSSSDTTLPVGTTLDYKLQYITVPLGLKLKSNQIGYITFYAKIGVTNQFNIHSKATSSEGTLKNDPVSKEINWYNLAYHFGGGIEYAIGEDTALDFSIIYHNGFLDVTNSSPTINSRVLSLRVGILF